MVKWNSLVPKSYHKSSIAPLVDRAIRICSTYTLLGQELNEIRKMAHFNDYPTHFVEKIICE